jgi:hypothetical protein
MKNIHIKNNRFIIVSLLAIFNFFIYARPASAQVSGKYLSADVGEADLMAIASKYPNLFWTVFVVLVVICMGYGANYIIKKIKK